MGIRHLNYQNDASSKFKIVHFIKPTMTIFFLAVIIISSSCVNIRPQPDANILGLYSVYDRECVGPVIWINECESIVFFEFVKGNFHGISKNEVAFVTWKGEKYSELSYSARKYDGRIELNSSFTKVMIDSYNGVNEYIDFSKNKVGVYFLEWLHPHSKKLLKTKFSIKQASIADAENYSMEYPGNN